MNPQDEMRAAKRGARAALEVRGVRAAASPETDAEHQPSVDSAIGSDDPTSRALEVVRDRDPNDARYETRDDPRIPEGKAFFKIGEVAEITGLKPYVLRYWEDEFAWIKPEKTRSRQRRYRRQDVALLLEISRLRYEELQTIEVARQTIRESRARKREARAKAGPRPTALGPEPMRLDRRAAPTAKPIARALSDMRKAVLELLEAAEE